MPASCEGQLRMPCMGWSAPTTTSNSGVDTMMSCICARPLSGPEVQTLALGHDVDVRTLGHRIEALLDGDIERDALDAVEVDDVALVHALAGLPAPADQCRSPR